MNWTGRSLALRLTIWFLLLSCVPLAVVSVIVGVEVRASMRTIISSRHEALAQSTVARWAEEEQSAREWIRQRRSKHEVMLVNRAGRIVLYHDQGWQGRPTSEVFDAWTVRRLRQEEHGAGFDTRGRIYGFATVRGSPEGLTVLVFSPPTELDGPMAAMNRSVLLKLGASLLLVALAGGLFIWAAVGVPLRVFTKAAEDVADGDLSIRVPPGLMDDELEALATSFNRMTDSLERSMADLEASEDRFRTMLDSLDDGVFVHDGETGVITDANPAACAMFGATREECLGLSVVDLSDGRAPFDAQAALDHCRRALAGERQVFEWRSRRRDGASFWTEVSLRRGLLDGQDRLLAVVRDTSARKEAEAALAESQRRLVAMMDSTRLCAAMLDVEGRVVYANSALAQALGDEPERLLGRDWFAEVVVPDDAEALRTEFLAMVRDGVATAHVENTLRTADGRLRQFVWDRTLLRDTQGQVVGTASLGRDVTDERELQERLRQSAKMEAIGQLAGGVAHDFNNLLTTIMGYTEVMLEAPGAYADELGEVLRATERASALTQQLLAFSRKQMLMPRVWDLNVIVGGMERMLSRIIGEPIDLVCHLGDGLPPVTVDRGQMEQVLLNLAVNARDAMPTGGQLSITTEACAMDGPNGQPLAGVCLRVADSGAGMPPAVKARIFEPFYTTKEVGRGTGLGLATVDGIVAQSGGTIRVESEPGHGATFVIWLPAAEGEPCPETPPPPAEPRAAAGTILVVEDDEMARGVVATALVRAGYGALLAADLDDALAVAREHQGAIDLLLCDVVLPKASGPEVAAAVTALRPGLPVLYMSGYTADALGQHGILDAGIQLIEKPFTPAQLGERVRQMLAG